MRIGVIGMGNRITGVLKQVLAWDDGAELAAFADIAPERAAARLDAAGISHEGVNAYLDAKTMLEDETLDGVMIGTRCNTHTQFAEMVMERKVPLFLEKPVFTTEEDMLRLKAAMKKQASPVIVSFPLRMTAIATAAKKIVDDGVLGELSQIQAVNNVSYGRGYFRKWYRNESITGGLFLQKATHDLDLVRYLTGLTPSMVCAMKSKRIYTGDKPAGLTCPKCNEYHSCPESTWVLEHKYGEKPQPDKCAFGVDTGNEDAGSALLLYPNGIHTAYSQNFVVRKSAGKRMVRLIGFAATLELDFYTGQLQVFHHREARTDTYAFSLGSSHFGGDGGLARAFLDLMQGKEVEHPTLYDGWISGLTCLRARDSSETMQFKAIEA